jgi:protein involved in ribonucleotide reduction
VPILTPNGAEGRKTASLAVPEPILDLLAENSAATLINAIFDDGRIPDEMICLDY